MIVTGSRRVTMDAAQIRQYQLVGEIEHRHSIVGRPGALRVTLFRNRGNFSRYADAVALAAATGQPVDPSLTRRRMTRMGGAINIEQEVTGTLGLFARAGITDGAIEPYDFTDIDRTAEIGGALNLGTEGLRDPDVTILDPATGTGTFLLGVAEHVRDQVSADEGGPAASMALRNLATRMFAFELLVGPYAVAHYRLHHALRNRPADDGEDGDQPVNLPSLGIYLADTLSDPDSNTPIGALGIQGIPIDDERAKAQHIKAKQPILAIVGNPPYKRLEEGENETLVGRCVHCR